MDDTERLPTCIGFGAFDGTCDRPADANETRLWCQRCEMLRRAHISRQFEQITASFRGD